MSEREEFPMKRILLVVALAFGLGVIVGCGGGTDTKATKKAEPTKTTPNTVKDSNAKTEDKKKEEKKDEKKEEKKDEKKEEKKDEKKEEKK
jgi:hypothetical protein